MKSNQRYRQDHLELQKKNKKYINEVRNYAINDAKWKNAIEYCKDRNMEFIIITEDELGYINKYHGRRNLF